MFGSNQLTSWYQLSMSIKQKAFSRKQTRRAHHCLQVSSWQSWFKPVFKMSGTKWNWKCQSTTSQWDRRKRLPAGCLPVVGSDMMTAGGRTCGFHRKSLRPVKINKQQGAQCSKGAACVCVCACLSLFRRAIKGRPEWYAPGQKSRSPCLIMDSVLHETSNVSLLLKTEETIFSPPHHLLLRSCFTHGFGGFQH